jgi:hypothetical protein
MDKRVDFALGTRASPQRLTVKQFLANKNNFTDVSDLVL